MSDKKVDKKEEKEKICFLITPINSADSEIRKRVDQWMKFIYKPALEPEYKVVRADDISSPGFITDQIINYIINADLCIIDLTGMNSNVMYELAIRHLSDKQYIHIFEQGTKLPFDISNMRCIPYDQSNLKYPEDLLEEIKKNVGVINSDKYEQPQIIKEKIVLNKITDDPKKFVDLLLKHLRTLKTEDDYGDK